MLDYGFNGEWTQMWNELEVGKWDVVLGSMEAPFLISERTMEGVGRNEFEDLTS